MHCPACNAPAPERSRFCPSCGGSLVASGDGPSSETPTQLNPDSHRVEARERRTPGSRARPISRSADGRLLSSEGSIDGARFVPGETIAERYRIIALLGKGGMGEVYRADDLKLGQAVALKFLPETLGRHPGRVARFYNEVRIARQVTHPNVCRVYDVDEFEGHHYISMEYIDGENLSGLLKRIGYLPKERAVRMARQLCAGLAAAHDRGILHRDLKPANVMIDGRGIAHITDFGLAELAAEIEGLEVRSGTPAYMAPEQLAGKEVSVASDVYSLGLVLYELFTGTPAFEASSSEELLRLQSESTPATPASIVEGFDPAVERVLLRCLEREPAQRPASALAVAAALPGGDPLAAALAAGETPSPEMVAAAGEQGGLRPGVAVALLAAFAALVVGNTVVGRTMPAAWSHPLQWSPTPQQPAVLAQKARELVAALGYEEPPFDQAFGFGVYTAYLEWIDREDESVDRWERLAEANPPAVFFWYRGSPDTLLPGFGDNTRVSLSDPPLRVPGEVAVHLNSIGQLDFLRVVPAQKNEPSGEAPAPDWEPLFAAAGLDRSAFQAVPPVWSPPEFADTRAAWEGTVPGLPEHTIRIEAAGFAGKPTWFEMKKPWDRPHEPRATALDAGQRALNVFFPAILLAALVAAVLLARRNLRQGHGDRRGALKLAIVVLTVLFLDWLLTASHVADLGAEFFLFLSSASSALFLAAVVWLAYVALEPFLRRRWPESMVSWSRLLSGRLRDPLVGRDILVGALAGVGFWGVVQLRFLIQGWMSVPPDQPEGELEVLLGGRVLLAAVINTLLGPMLISGVLLLLLLLLRVVLRKHWIALAAMVLLLSFPQAVQSQPRMLFPNLLLNLVLWAGVYMVLTRFGLLSMCALFLTVVHFGPFPALDLSTWYATNTLVLLLPLFTLVGFAFMTSLAGRSLFAGGVVPD